MQKKNDVIFFSKNIRFHTFWPEKTFKLQFFTQKIAFDFSEIFNFLEIDLLGKKSFKWLFFIQNGGEWCFYQKKSDKIFFSTPLFPGN